MSPKTKAPPLGLRLYAFTVTKSAVMIVAARNDAEAGRVADEFASDAMLDADYIEVQDEGEVNEGSWYVKEHGSDLPWCDAELNPDDLTVAEMLEARKHGPPTPDESLGPVVWCTRCHGERVQWDWREEEQVCRLCREEEA